MPNSADPSPPSAAAASSAPPPPAAPPPPPPPSLFNPHKAGLAHSDRVRSIVASAASGGRFYENEVRKESEMTSKLAALRTRIARAPTDTAAADRVIADTEARRAGLGRTFVCVDFDAFFAAVSELDDPSLRGRPHAVGGGEHGVLSTSSYVARGFGVRSAMPVYIARRLCPELVIVKSDFKRYRELSDAARERVFSRFGKFEMRSIDEAIIDVTEYLEEHGVSAEVAVEELRAEVKEVTGGLTVSAGVAATPTLSKICADLNKPDDAFILGNTRADIVAFCAGLQLRKVPFLGKVSMAVRFLPRSSWMALKPPHPALATDFCS